MTAAKKLQGVVKIPQPRAVHAPLAVKPARRRQFGITLLV
jgi:hypothetical protein